MTSRTGVALRKESVDRNGMEIDGVSYDVWSLSARRAWIEICIKVSILFTFPVALRKESVDRNCLGAKADSVTKWSLSARRAWIEIENTPRALCIVGPSLSARRAWIEIMTAC